MKGNKISAVLAILAIFVMTSCGIFRKGRCGDCPEFTQQHEVEVCMDQASI